MATAIIQEPHYFMALLVAQNKKTITQPYFLNICNFVYQQDIKASGIPKNSASNVQDSGGESDGGGKPKAVTNPKQKRNTHEYDVFLVTTLVRFLQLQIPRSNLCFLLKNQIMFKEVNLKLKQPVI